MELSERIAREIAEAVGWGSQDWDFYLKHDWRKRPLTGSGKDGKNIHDQVIVIIDRHLAAQSQWRNIESAPKDGTHILVVWPYWSKTRPVVAWYDTTFGCWEGEKKISSIGPDPDLWQPLPPLPPPPSAAAPPDETLDVEARSVVAIHETCGLPHPRWQSCREAARVQKEKA